MDVHHEVSTTGILHYKTYVTLKDREGEGKGGGGGRGEGGGGSKCAGVQVAVGHVPLFGSRSEG